MDLTLSRQLHALTAQLDRAADRILRAHAGLSYPRFLALYMIGTDGSGSQRLLAERLGITEPSVSRMAKVLAAEGLVEATPHPAGGNRHTLQLTPAGRLLVERWGGLLEERLAELVAASGVPYGTYARHTQQLLNGLAAADPDPDGRPSRATS